MIDLKTYFRKAKSKYATTYAGLSARVGLHRALEINLYFDLRICFNLMIGYTTKTDHAGFTFRLDICGLEFELMIYDTRHWNDKLDRWYLPGEEENV